MYFKSIYTNNKYGDKMNNYSIYPYRTDLIFNDKDFKKNNNQSIYVLSDNKDHNDYKTILFNSIKDKDIIINTLMNEILFFFKEMNISKKDHIFIVGLGNENHTADSVGPKALKYISVNAYLENIGTKINGNKVSALEPGVLGETGILTEKIIKSIADTIKPNLVILIDSFVSDNINYLNKTIEINNRGLNPGSGIKGITSKIDKNSLGIPVLVIGVNTAVEIKFTNNDNINFIPYLLSTKDIDDFVDNIALIIGTSIVSLIHTFSISFTNFINLSKYLLFASLRFLSLNIIKASSG